MTCISVAALVLSHACPQPAECWYPKDFSLTCLLLHSLVLSNDSRSISALTHAQLLALENE